MTHFTTLLRINASFKYCTQQLDDLIFLAVTRLKCSLTTSSFSSDVESDLVSVRHITNLCQDCLFMTSTKLRVRAYTSDLYTCGGLLLSFSLICLAVDILCCHFTRGASTLMMVCERSWTSVAELLLIPSTFLRPSSLNPAINGQETL